MKPSDHHHHHDHTPPPSGLDGLGVLLSGLCLIHCIATPFLASLLPLAFWFEDEHGFHLRLAVILLPLGAVAFWRGFKRHSRKSILLTGVAGLVLLLMGVLVHSSEKTHGFETSGISFTILGSLVLVFAHWKNWRYSRCLVCHLPKLETQPRVPDDPITCASASDSEHRHLQA